MKRMIPIAALAALFAVGSATADTWYVSKTGSDTNGGTGPDDAFATPAAAFSVAKRADTIVIGAGTYTCSIESDLDSLTIRGETGDPADVILDAGGAANTLSLNAANVTVEGLTFTGASTFGLLLTGADASESPLVQNCVFTANHRGFGLYHADNATIKNCVFSDNSSRGVRTAYSNFALWTDCRFLRNPEGITDHDWNAGDRNGPSNPQTFVRCIFAHHSGTAANLVADNAGAGSVFDHCTFFDNVTGVFYGHYYGGTITNSIVAGTYNYPSSWRGAGSVWDSVTKSLLHANGPHKWTTPEGGAGPNNFGGDIIHDCFDGEPSFVDPYADDFRLYADSDAALAANLCEDGTICGAYPDPADLVAIPSETELFVTPATIADAVSHAEPGDVITLESGDYPAITLSGLAGSATRPIRIVGGEGVKFTNSNGAGITLENVSNVSLENFEVSGCSGHGIAIRNGYGWAVADCSVIANGDTGIDCVNTLGGLVSDCIVSTNRHHGVNLACAAGNTIYRSFIERNGNSGTVWCYGVNMIGKGLNNVQGYATANKVIECSVSGNYYMGIAMPRCRDEGIDGHVFCNEVTSCVVDGNGTGSHRGYGIGTGIRGSVIVSNTIVAHNNQEAFHSEGAATIIADYCDIFGNGGIVNQNGVIGDTCIYTDPKLVDTTISDFHLWEGSPCIAKGFDGEKAIDIGMYPNGPVKEIEVGGDFFVKPDGDDSADGKSWATAFATVARAATAATAGSSVTIAEGSYTGTVAIAASATGMDGLPVVYRAVGPVELVGEDGPALTLSSATWNEFHGIAFTSATDNGATLENGSDLLFSNCTFNACGAYGVYASLTPRITFADCEASGNRSHGLYLLNSNDAVIDDCTIVGNTGAGIRAGEGRGYPCTGVIVRDCYVARNGGYGIATPGDSCTGWLVEHCSIIGNVGCAFGYDGGGHWSTATITNNVIAYNIGGGIYQSLTTLDVADNIFYLNAGDNIIDGRGIADANASDKGGNVEVNPSVCNWFDNDDCLLFADSPAIGAADDGSNYGCYQGEGVALPTSATYYVSPDGSDDNDGSSEDSAFATISAAALAATNPGDTVYIAAGEYAGPQVISNAVSSATAPIRYIAEDGAVVVGPSNGNALKINQVVGIEISGLGLTGCTGNFVANLELIDTLGCTFESIACTNGFYGVHAVYRALGNTFRNCLFANNSNCGLYMGGAPDTFLDHCMIRDNASHGLHSVGHDGQWYCTSAGLVIRHSISSGNGGAGFSEGNYGCINAENCVVVGNGANGVQFTDNSRPSSIRNTIVYGNTGVGLRITGGGHGDLVIENDCFYANTDGDKLTRDAFEFDESVVLADPLFRNAANGDYHIAIGSPCMDAGTNQAWMVEAKDYAGVNPRIIRDVVDIGLYEVGVYGTMIMVK